MSKLRKAVSRAHLKLLVVGEDEAAALRPKVLDHRERRKRRARAADDLIEIGSHLPANGNGAQGAPEEPEAIREARARLRAMIVAATKDAPKPSVGIVLAIVNQETGNHAAANALIDEYGLERLFGIKKFCPNDLTR